MTTKRIDDTKIVRCNRCGSVSCAWVKSERTGRFYLAYAQQGTYRSPGAVVHTHILHDCNNPATGGKGVEQGRTPEAANIPADLMYAARTWAAITEAEFDTRTSPEQYSSLDTLRVIIHEQLTEHPIADRRIALFAARNEQADRLDIGRNLFNAKAPATETRSWFELTDDERDDWNRRADGQPTKAQERMLGWFGNPAGEAALKTAFEDGRLF
jgi:hypothetical protein